MTFIQKSKAEIHAPVISMMDAMGWGLLTDGETFYKKGYELDPRGAHFTFTMSQAYEIAKIVEEGKRMERDLTIQYLSAKLSDDDKEKALRILRERETVE